VEESAVSGFEWEVGWNPVVIDETTWEPGIHQGGHQHLGSPFPSGKPEAGEERG